MLTLNLSSLSKTTHLNLPHSEPFLFAISSLLSSSGDSNMVTYCLEVTKWCDIPVKRFWVLETLDCDLIVVGLCYTFLKDHDGRLR